MSDAEARVLVASEVQDLQAAARQYDSMGATEQAATFAAQAAIIHQFLSPRA